MLKLIQRDLCASPRLGIVPVQNPVQYITASISAVSESATLDVCVF